MTSPTVQIYKETTKIESFNHWDPRMNQTLAAKAFPHDHMKTLKKMKNLSEYIDIEGNVTKTKS